MQIEPLAEQIMRQIDQAAMQYHRLILVVAPSGAEKTAVLQEIAKRTGFRCINVNLLSMRRASTNRFLPPTCPTARCVIFAY